MKHIKANKRHRSTYLLAPSYGEMYMQGNATATTISGTSTPVKVDGTTSEGLTENFTHTTGRLTCNNPVTHVYRVIVSLDAIAAVANQDCKFYVAKGGSVVAKSEIDLELDNAVSRALGLSVLLSLAADEYIECFVSNETGTNDITVEDLQLSIVKVL